MANTPDDIRKQAKETASIIEDALRSIASQIGDIFEQTLTGADKVTQSTAKDIQARFNKMAKVTDDVASNIVRMQEGLLSTKNIQDQINKRKAQEIGLGIQLTTILKQQGVQASNIEELIEGHNNGTLRLTRKQKELVKEYLKTKSINDDYIEQLKIQNEEVNRQEKALGNTGKLIKGISKIPVLGNLIDAENVLAAAQAEAAKEGSDRTKVLGAAFKALGSSLKSGLLDPLTLVVFVFKQIKDAFISIDAGSGKLAKDMNMSYSEAVNFRGELSKIATLSADNAINTKGLQESYTAIGQSLGANADINEKDLIVFTKLREQAGYTNDELVSMQKLSLVTGKSVEDTAKEFFGSAKALSAQKGLAINVKQLLKETANTSNAIKLSLLGAKGGLAEAAVKAKEFGINLEQADKIAGSLLNFEDSISAELEAELLTGKQLNLETARYAALTGDIGTMAEEINKQIGGSAEFTKMNRIQQEAYARAVGMSREELANSLVEQEGLQRIGVSTAAQAREKYDNLRKTMSAEEARKALGDDELARQYEQQSVQERFTQAVEKLKDIFVTIAEGPIGKIAGFIANILSNSTAMFAVFGGLGGLLISSIIPSMGKMAAVLRLIRMRGIASAIGSIIKGAWEALGGLPVVGPILAGAAIATGIGFLMSKSKETPGLAKGGTVVGAGSVLVGEQGPEVLSMKPGATVTPLSKVNAASEGGKNADISINAGNTIIQLDGVTIAKAITPYVVEEMRKTSVKIQ